MQKASTSISLLLAFSLSSLAQVRLQPPPPPTAKLIKAGRILDVRTGKYLLDHGILTDGEKIKETGPWTEVQAHAPKDVVLIDLSQATLLPGLIDCHAHPLISAELGRMDAWQIVIATVTQTSASL
jgi:imidazolonepropionase-like amidohydrolase